jgi:hypothetical protein
MARVLLLLWELQVKTHDNDSLPLHIPFFLELIRDISDWQFDIRVMTCLGHADALNTGQRA